VLEYALHVKPCQSVLIRSTSGGFEPRFESAREFLKGFGDPVTPIIWSRTVRDYVFLDCESENVFEIQANYGRGWRNLFSHLKFSLFILRRLQVIKPKLIYACDMDTLLPSLIWALNKKVVIVFDQFDPLSIRTRNRFLSLIIGRLEIYLSKKSDIKITANKLRIPDDFRDDWFELKNAFGFDLNLKEFHKKKPPFVLFYGGILSPDRGLLACAAAVSQEPDWEFHLYGQGSISDLFVNGKFRNVFMHEPVVHEELMRIAKSADLFLAMYDPSRSNNQFTASNKLFEAAQLGIPLLTSRYTQLGDVVEDHDLGWTVKHGDTKEISAILSKCKKMDRKEKLQAQRNLQDFFTKEQIEKQKVLHKLTRVLSSKLEA
jgi:glycosyltransferase involved in cell wall biosynthesis